MLSMLNSLVETSFRDQKTLQQAAEGAKAGGFDVVQSAPILYLRYSDTAAQDMATVLANIWSASITPKILTTALQSCLILANSRAYDNVVILSSVQQIFPTPAANFASPTIETSHCNVNTGPRTLYKGRYWILHGNNQSYFNITFNNSFGGFPALTKSTMKLTHLSSAPGPSNITIIINGRAYKKSYNPPSHNWVYDSFDISDFITQGSNTIELKLLNSAATNYWLNHFSLDYS